MSGFVRVPNQIIKYSCMVNHIILPVYLYSAIHCNPNNGNIVDTNLAHISETFAPNEDSRRKIHLKVEDVVRMLLTDVEDYEYEYEDKKYKLEGFSACFAGDVSEGVDKTTRIQYKFLDRDVKFENGYVVLDYEEYFYLLNKITDINSEKGKTTIGNKWNLIDLINLYMYLKMRIIYYENTAKAKNTTAITMHESVDKISRILGVGNKTISKYVNQLVELGMICTKLANYKEGKSTVYNLSDKWKE